MKRLLGSLAALLLTALVVTLHAATPALVSGTQHGAADNSGATAVNSPTGVTNGNTVIIGVGQFDADNDQTFSVSDNVNGAYTSAVGPIRSTGATGDRACQIFYKTNVSTTAGALTITTTRAGGTAGFRVQWLEVSNLGTSPVVVTGSSPESSSGTSHTGAAAGVTTASDVFAYMIAASSSTAGGFTATTPPTFVTLTGDFSSQVSVSQYYANATGLSANTLSWSSGSSRTFANCTATFTPATASTYRSATMLGGV